MVEVVDAVKAAIKSPKPKAGEAVGSSNPLVVARALLNPLKTLCNGCDANVREAARYLLLSLANRSGLVRMRSLFVLDYLFNRCKLFRQLINDDISTVVNCCAIAGVHRSASSSSSSKEIKAPDGYSAEIETKVKELVELWDTRHGGDCPKLHCMARYLRESLRVAMPNVQASALSHLARIEANRAVLFKKVLRRNEKVLRDELPLGEREAQDSIDKLEACFSILFPPAAQSATAPSSSSEWARVSSLEGEGEGEGDGIDWEEEEGVTAANHEEQEGGAEDSVLFANGVAPFALNIDLRRGLADKGGRVLEDTVRELSSHLRRYVAPQLQQWQHVLARGLRVYRDCAAERSGGGSGVGLGAEKGVLGSRGGVEVTAERLRTEAALRRVALLLLRVNGLLAGRCADFLDGVAMDGARES